jgi:hypothetical protein
VTIRPIGSDNSYTAPQTTTPHKTQTAFDKQVLLANATQQQPTARERVDSAHDRLSGLTSEYNEKQNLGEPFLKQLKGRSEVLRQDVDKLKNEVEDRQIGRELTALQRDLRYLQSAIDHRRVELLDRQLDDMSQVLVYRETGGKQFKSDLESLRKDVDKLKEELGPGELGRKLTDIDVGIDALGYLANDQTVLNDAQRVWQELTRLSTDVADHLTNVAKDPTKKVSPGDFDIAFTKMHLRIAQFEQSMASNINAQFNNERVARSMPREVTRPFYDALNGLRTEITNHSTKR